MPGALEKLNNCYHDYYFSTALYSFSVCGKHYFDFLNSGSQRNLIKIRQRPKITSEIEWKYIAVTFEVSSCHFKNSEVQDGLYLEVRCPKLQGGGDLWPSYLLRGDENALDPNLH